MSDKLFDQWFCATFTGKVPAYVRPAAQKAWNAAIEHAAAHLVDRADKGDAIIGERGLISEVLRANADEILRKVGAA